MDDEMTSKESSEEMEATAKEATEETEGSMSEATGEETKSEHKEDSAEGGFEMKADEEATEKEMTEASAKKEMTEATSEKKEMTAAAEATTKEESSQKLGEESSQKLGEESSREGGVAGIAGKSADDRLTRIEEMLNVLLEAQQEIAKALSQDEVAKSVQEVAERLAVVEKSATKSAPVRMAVGDTKPTENENIVRAREYRAKSMSTTNPVLAQGYLSLALDLEKNL